METRQLEEIRHLAANINNKSLGSLYRRKGVLWGWNFIFGNPHKGATSVQKPTIGVAADLLFILGCGGRGHDGVEISLPRTTMLVTRARLLEFKIKGARWR